LECLAERGEHPLEQALFAGGSLLADEFVGLGTDEERRSRRMLIYVVSTRIVTNVPQAVLKDAIDVT